MGLNDTDNTNQHIPCIVFIVDGYYPNYSANGICVSSIVDVLSKSNKIIIIAPRDDNEQQEINVCHYDIRHYDYFDNHMRKTVEKKLDSAKGLKKIFFICLKRVVQVHSVVKVLTSKTSINNQKTKGILKELESINERIKVVIPVCLPFESIIAAIRFKAKTSNQVKVIPFLIDKFSANPTLHRTEKNRSRKFQKHLDMETEVFIKCDWLLYIGGWEKHIYKNHSEFERKFCRVEIPLLRRIATNKRIIYDNEKINIVYTGHLYKEIRSPEFVLKVLSKVVEKNKSVMIHFYIRGNCGQIVNSYCEKYPENIINHGLVPTDVAKAAIMSANILLSIGNKDISELPSKTFEYISTGKPVLHFFFSKEDPVVNILNQYGNSFCVEIDNQHVDFTASVVFGWIEKPREIIEFDEVEKMFYNATPQFTANKVVFCINESSDTQEK